MRPAAVGRFAGGAGGGGLAFAAAPAPAPTAPGREVGPLTGVWFVGVEVLGCAGGAGGGGGGAAAAGDGATISSRYACGVQPCSLVPRVVQSHQPGNGSLG